MNNKGLKLSEIKKENQSLKYKINYLNRTLASIYNSRTWQILRIYQKAENSIKNTLRFFSINNISTFIFSKLIPKPWKKILLKSYFRFKYPKYSKNKDFNQNKPDVIIFSIISWYHQFQRSHHFASLFAKNNHRVFYIENSFNFCHKKNLQLEDIAKKIGIKKINSNLYLVKLVAFSSFNIYEDSISIINKKYLNISLEALYKYLDTHQPIIKIDYPAWYQIINATNKRVIYDCMDEHRGFWTNTPDVLSFEKPLAKMSQFVIASSKVLVDKMKKINEKSFLIRNACDYYFFNHQNKIENKIITKNSKIIGYIGSIADWFDDLAVAKIAQEFSKLKIILIGAVSDRTKFNSLKKYENIKFLGQKKYPTLPSYLKQFDVCLIPFKKNMLIRSTNPVKMYEYFSLGKPVVSVDIPETREVSKLLYLANDEKDYVKQVYKALNENNKNNLINQRKKFSEKNTWEIRFKELSNLINTIIYPKISIIILNYNTWKYTKACLESIISTTYYPNIEIIIIDNASSDESKNYLNNLPKKPWLKIIFNKINRGFAGGNNIGIKKSNGKFIVLLNNDTIVTKFWLEKLINKLTDKNIGLVGPVTNWIGNEAKINLHYHNIQEMHKKALEYTTMRKNKTFEINNLAFFCVAGRKEVFHQVGEIDERFKIGSFEDDDYCLRIKKAGYKLICAEDVFIHHYGRATTGKMNEFFENFPLNKKKFEDKWQTTWTPHKYR